MVSVTVEFTAQTRSSRGRAARAAYFTDPSNQVDVNVSVLIRKCALVDIWTFYSRKNENFIIKHKQQLEGKDRLAAARLLCEAGVKFAEAVILKLKLLEVQLTAESTPVHVSLPDSSTQVSVLQVSLDVRGITLRIPIPCRLPESENSPAGLWQGGAVDSGSHPVQDPLPASQVNSHKHTDQQCSVSQQGSKKCVSYIGLFQSFYCWIIKRKTCFFPKKNQDINSCVMCDVGVVSRDLQQETLRQSHSSWLRSSFVYNHHLFSLCILVVVLAILLYILRLRRIHQREQRQAEALNLLWVEEGEALLPWGRGRVLMTRRVHVCRIRTTTKQCECGGQIREPGRSSTSQGWDLASEDEKRRARILFCGKTSQHRVGLMSLESNCSVLTLIVQLQTERHFLPLYFGRKESTQRNRIEQLSLFCPHFSKDPKPRVWAYLHRQSGRLASIRWVDRCRDRRRRRWCSPAEDI